MKSIETQLHEANEQIKSQIELIVSLKRVIHQKQIKITNIERDWKLKDAGLPAESIARIHQAFAGSTNNNGLKEAINVERKIYGRSISKVD